MNEIVKLGTRLCLFSFIAASGLAVTYEVTKGPINEQKMAAKRAALETVLPGCEYEPIEFENLADGSDLDEIFIGRDATGNVSGYALTASPNGYGGEIPITMGVSAEGYVTQVYVGSLQETAGLGSKVGDAPFKEQFIGIAADPDTLRSDDKISGASVSSGAFLNASEQILAYTKGTLGIEPHAGDKDAILAAAAAASGNGEEAATDDTAQTTAEANGAAEYDVTGFQPFKVAVETDADGKIVSVSVPSHNETPGLGADLIADTAVFEALVGQDVSAAQIDTRAGVTLTSNAINDALRQAAAAAASGPATYDVTGFQPFQVSIETDADGKIVSVSVPSHNETPGLGADLIADAAVFDALKGKSIQDAQIDVRAGVTMTSNAINDALRQAAQAAGGDEAAEVNPGDPYTVKGMNKFTVYIEAADGKVVSVSVPAHNETPGLGADLLTEEALSALVGQELDNASVDVKAGVTLTSNALNSALEMAAAANGVDRAVPEEEEQEREQAEEAAAEVQEEAADEAAAAEEVAAEAAEEVQETTETSEAEAATYEVTGFQPFAVEIAVDGEGKITSVKVPSHNETPGLGAALIEDAAVFEALVGQDIATAQIDTRAGVTLTSNAINDALKQAAAQAGASDAEAAEEAPAEAQEAAEPAESAAVQYEVTGFQPFTVEIAVDGEGKIASVKVPSHNETPGFGAALIEDAAVFEALIGQDIATAQIDTRAGATLTSNAINDALQQAAKEAK